MELINHTHKKKDGNFHDAETVSALYLPWEPIDVMPIGDIQYDGKKGATDVPRLRRHIAWGMKHKVWFIGMGDIVDFMSTSNRTKLAASGIYDTAQMVIDHAAEELENEIFDIMRPTIGRWIGNLQGHHYFEHLDGSTSDTRFAEMFQCPFLGDCTIVNMRFKEEGKGHRSKTLKTWAHHGTGGAGVTGTAVLNRMYHQKVRYPYVRLFLHGHVPILGHLVLEGLDSTDSATPHLTHEDTHLVATGGFSRSYQQGSSFKGRAQGGYAEKAMYPPAVLGGSLIHITPERFERHGREYTTIDVKVTS